MQPVAVGARTIDSYAAIVGSECVRELHALAEPLAGARVLHVNATPVGGGVAEILRSEIGLLRDLGVTAEWVTLDGDAAFFNVTKKIHNALQGNPDGLTADEEATYREWQARNAATLPAGFDAIVVHDPQPLGLLHYAGRGGARWIWRLHVDSATPNRAVWRFLQPFLEGYDAAVFTLRDFVPPGVPPQKTWVIAPAIDPLTPKNRPLPYAVALPRLSALGLDPGRPIMAQVARLDPWKDPCGVIDAYRLVRERVRGVQLALLGVIAARDDPEAVGMYHQVADYAGDDPDIHIYVDPEQVGEREVGAVQLGAQVVLQKSQREGFGLSVTEALWKASPVVGGRAGGIPLQIDDGVDGFLVESAAEAAERCCWLLDHPSQARSLAARGRERVRERFLITRLLADDLRLYTDVLGETGAEQRVAD